MKSKKEISEIFDRIYSLYPDTKTELDYETSFQFLVAVIMSAQATDKQVNRINDSFFRKIREPKDIMNMSLEDIENELKSLNYYKHKSLYIKQVSQKLHDEFNSVIPDNLDALIRLPGIGIKTAKVVLGVLYDAPYVGVDTHVHRVTNRLGIVKTKTPEETDRILEKILTIEQKRKMHHALVLFGRYNCTARKPKCKGCKAINLCSFEMKNI
ncbi:MAG: endonuclease III [Candidatus Gracilibacteria bacterium]|nr:endonuclease III [Candidatus Gracilibacteria bacterium]